MNRPVTFLCKLFYAPSQTKSLTMSLYNKRGVSAQKEDVHKAIGKLSKGLYPYAFCKIYPDYIGNDSNMVNLMHADGAGTKSILAYLYWKETGDLSVWKGIAQDAVVMNLDDLLCVGIHDNFLFSSTIDRNKSVIPGEVLERIINGTQEIFDSLREFGVNIHFMGGETADVGDVVRTIAVNGTMMARWPKEQLITNEKISAGDVIVGFASYGKADYETVYNSGIGSNGLTSARHDALSKYYAENFPETYEPSLPEEVVYPGKGKMTDEGAGGLNLGKLLLSPTRTYAPLAKAIFSEMLPAVHGMIHCSGGGQTKCLKYLPQNFHIIKDNLFAPPPVFNIIQEFSGVNNYEMYQVFNMGHRLEIFTNEQSADKMIALAGSFGIEAKVIGRVESGSTKSLTIQTPAETLQYQGESH